MVSTGAGMARVLIAVEALGRVTSSWRVLSPAEARHDRLVSMALQAYTRRRPIVEERDELATEFASLRHAALRSRRLRTLPPTARDEVLSDVYLALVESWDHDLSHRPPNRRVNWIISVTNHKAVDYVRRQAVQRRLADRIAARAGAEAPTEMVDRLPSHFWHALFQLPPRQQTVVMMLHLGGWSRADVAEELGISINTVKTQNQRGLHRLRVYARRYGLGEWLSPDRRNQDSKCSENLSPVQRQQLD